MIMTFKCDTCFKYFEDADEFQKHMEEEFGWNETAEDEDVNNDGAMTVKVERNVTEEHKTFKCKSCGKDYKNQKCYEKHVPCRRKTDAERVKSYYWEKVKLEPKQCLTCGDMLASSSALKLHIRSIHEGSKFYCDQCDAVFTTKGNLKVHIAGKHEGKTYPCELCDYRPAKKQLLKKHLISIHSTEMMMCELCTFTSNTKDKLLRHIKGMHEKIKYACLYRDCSHEATEPSNLKAHVRDIHGPQEWQCNKCDFKANRLRKLNGHRKSVHAEVITAPRRKPIKIWKEGKPVIPEITERGKTKCSPMKREGKPVVPENIKREKTNCSPKKLEGIPDKIKIDEKNVTRTKCSFLKPVALKIDDKSKVLCSFKKKGFVLS